MTESPEDAQRAEALKAFEERSQRMFERLKARFEFERLGEKNVWNKSAAESVAGSLAYTYTDVESVTDEVMETSYRKYQARM